MVTLLLAMARVGWADEEPVTTHVSGHVWDSVSSAPVPGTLVYVISRTGRRVQLVSDNDGAYDVFLTPGSYTVTFVYGDARQSRQLDVGTTPITFDGTIDSWA